MEGKVLGEGQLLQVRHQSNEFETKIGCAIN
jgi:hypothetical protein